MGSQFSLLVAALPIPEGLNAKVNLSFKGSAGSRTTSNVLPRRAFVEALKTHPIGQSMTISFSIIRSSIGRNKLFWGNLSHSLMPNLGHYTVGLELFWKVSSAPGTQISSLGNKCLESGNSNNFPYNFVSFILMSVNQISFNFATNFLQIYLSVNHYQYFVPYSIEM